MYESVVRVTRAGKDTMRRDHHPCALFGLPGWSDRAILTFAAEDNRTRPPRFTCGVFHPVDNERRAQWIHECTPGGQHDPRCLHSMRVHLQEYNADAALTGVIHKHLHALLIIVSRGRVDPPHGHELVYSRPYRPHHPFWGGDGADVKPPQIETARLALHNGFYDYPRRCTLADLGNMLGISKSSVFHRLSPVERAALSRYLEDKSEALTPAQPL